jgi:hypothetical protein
MPLTRKSQLKKLKVSELKTIIKDNQLGSVAGKKQDLVDRIGNAPNFKTIKSTINIPVRVRAPPSAKQIKVRQNFQKMVFEKHNKIKLKNEGVSIRELESRPDIQIKEITKKRKKKKTKRARKGPPGFKRPRTP